MEREISRTHSVKRQWLTCGTNLQDKRDFSVARELLELPVQNTSKPNLTIESQEEIVI